MSTIDVVIVNWNAGQHLRRCLLALSHARMQHHTLARVVVVDNASSDGSLDQLDADGLPLEVIRNRSNEGFAAACNLGAARSQADYLLFLNPDTRVHHDAIERAAHFLDEGDRVGIVGAQLTDSKGRVQTSCARFPSPGRFTAKALALDRILPHRFPPHFMVEWDHADTREVDQVMGAFFMTRRGLFELLGGFDERFFVYFEEVDYSLRVRQAGYSSWFLAEAHVRHAGGGTTESVPDRRLYYSLRSRILFGFKHFSRAGATAQLLSTLTVEAAARLLQAAAQRSLPRLRSTLRAYGRLLAALPDMTPYFR